MCNLGQHDDSDLDNKQNLFGQKSSPAAAIRIATPTEGRRVV